MSWVSVSMMCCPLPSLYFRPGSSRVSQLQPSHSLLFSGPCWRLQGKAIPAVMQKSSREETLREQSAGVERCFPWVFRAGGWEALPRCVATGGHCLAVIMAPNELPGTRWKMLWRAPLHRSEVQVKSSPGQKSQG